MKLSVMSPVLNDMGLIGAVTYLSELGVDSIELGVGGYPGKALCDAKDFLEKISYIPTQAWECVSKEGKKVRKGEAYVCFLA